jgi:MTH538 TIR-like domain (DUF1863)
MPRDRQWALRIMAELETYRTPKALQREAFPDRIGHLFRDEDEIPASTDLSDQIKDALGKSDFLIVVCSPDTPASRWVCREIELFQEMGKSERIFPLLIAGEPEDSFPPELLRRRVWRDKPDGSREEIWEEIEPIAADVRPRKDERQSRTERRALLRLAAALLGCRFDDLARRDEERRKKQLRQQLGAGTALLTAASIGGLWWWDANLRIKTQYCANYAERWGVPECVGELGAGEQQARTTSYRFKTQGGLVLEMARVNGTGALRGMQNSEYEEEPWTENVALWRFTYVGGARESQPRLATAKLEGVTGNKIREISYKFGDDRSEAIAAFDHDLGVAERQSAEGSTLGLHGTTHTTSHFRTNIGQHRLSFDAQGHLLRRAFEPVGGGITVADAIGAYGRLYTYGALNLVETLRNLDMRGEVLVEKSGLTGQRHWFSSRGDLARVEWFNEKSEPRANVQGFASVVLDRDAKGNIVREDYRNEAGAPAIRRDRRFASLSQAYDARGNEVEESYFGLDGKPAFDKDGYARVARGYDERGNKVEEAYFGLDGKPAANKDGVARTTNRYDARGNEVEKAGFGLDGKPALDKDGYARVARGYDERGTRWKRRISASTASRRSTRVASRA